MYSKDNFVNKKSVFSRFPWLHFCISSFLDRSYLFKLSYRRTASGGERVPSEFDHPVSLNNLPLLTEHKWMFSYVTPQTSWNYIPTVSEVGKWREKKHIERVSPTLIYLIEKKKIISEEIIELSSLTRTYKSLTFSTVFVLLYGYRKADAR